MEHSLPVDRLPEAFASGAVLTDIRDAVSFEYGTIPGAVSKPALYDEAENASLARECRYILCDKDGSVSPAIAEKMRLLGYDAVSLAGGYAAWLEYRFAHPDPDKRKEVEKSLSKQFSKCLFTPFVKAINEFDMVCPGDKIAVCISGGKDSMLLAKLFQQLKRHNKFPFELVFLVMDPGYSPANHRAIERNAELLGIPVTIFESTIFDTVYGIEKSPCYLCARMRRGYLYSKAKALGCNKIALGHHYDDVIETILMGMLYGGQVQTMMPKLRSTNFEGMELIRPMYLVREKDIKRWRDQMDLHFLQCACRFTETCTSCREDGSSASKRMEIKQLIANLKQINPMVESNIYKSVMNVNLATVIRYKDKEGVPHSFLEEY
ncbi:MAG: ATP-binding protein [Clostridia bacterium]|nr:ATP-binding protein [Clostridia bacterium]